MTDRKQWKTGLSIGRISEEALDRAARAGLDVVEICAIKDDDPANWKKIPEWEKKTGVKVWSFHLPFNRLHDPATLDPECWKTTLEDDKAFIEHCGEIGVKYMVCHPSIDGQYKPEERESHMQSALEHLTVLSDICKANGCVLCVEDLPRTCLGNSSDEMLRIMESNSDLRIVFDVNHLLKESHTEFVKKVGKYIVTTHISDYDFVDEKHWFPMQGQINWREVQSALELADYKGPFLYETMPEGFTWADVRKNHELLKNL